MFGLVVASLRGGIDGAVWDLPAGDAERFHHPTLRLLHALGRLGVDGDVAGLVAGELHLAALLVALGDLFSISRTARVLADWALTPQCSKVPGSVLHAGHDVRLLGGLSSQAEGLVLAAEEESCLVGGGQIVSVVSARDLRRGPTVNGRTLRLGSTEPVVRHSVTGVVDTLSEPGSCSPSQWFANLVAGHGDVLTEPDLQVSLVGAEDLETLGRI